MEPHSVLYRYFGKRLADISAVLVLAPVLVSLIAVLSIAVWFMLGRPVFFAQLRPGKGGRLFTLWKFRSMTSERDAQGDLLPDEARLTRFGRFMRSTSLDELPQFWSVLRGDMSCVGPRPLMVDYLGLYTPEQSLRHDVKPGLTGLAQVKGRNSLSWEARFSYDLEYVRKYSLGLDLKILLWTIQRVLTRAGITAGDHPTMPAFKGTIAPTTSVDQKAA